MPPSSVPEPAPVTSPGRVEAGVEHALRRRLAAARARLEARGGAVPAPPSQYRLPPERPFTAAERGSVTVLIGGLTGRHDRLLQAVLESCGHRCEPLPQADLAACFLGKQYCNNGVCNPAYFTIGNLLKHLRALEASGLTRQEVVDRYVFLTAGSCGPCRFGMYEAEYRLALRNAGYDGFRVLLFQQEHGVKARTGEAGLDLNLHLGLGVFNAFTFGDVLNVAGYEARPFEVVPGATDRALGQATAAVASLIAGRPEVKPADLLPPWLWQRVAGHAGLAGTVRVLAALREHLYGAPTAAALDAAARSIGAIEVDRLRVKPAVKVVGEFWAQTTEGDGNFNMFSFLEREGAHVIVEPLGVWVLHLLHQARAHLLDRRGLAVPRTGPSLARLRAWRKDTARVAARRLWIDLGEAIYRRHFDRVRGRVAGLGHPLVDQRIIAELAHPYYHRLAQGGEEHMEVGKALYYTARGSAHLVLSLKPFGCMPSMQSDGVQSLVAAHFKDMQFLPVETAADGELAAHSRVQMALVEARARAQSEFQRALESTGRRLEDVQAYVAAHPELRRLDYRVPHAPGVAGVAASFVRHVSDLMDRDRRRRPFGGFRLRPQTP
jgi:predicted nucleotide-binding protein (sugar kinase/HSP70/actin superfamily)